MSKRCFAALFLWLTVCVHSQPAEALSGTVTGAWFDPAFEGAGFLVEVLAEDQALVYWFTYDDSGAQRWYIGVGEATDSSIEISDLQEATGGRFGPEFDPDEVSLRTVGTLTLSFSSCNAGSADYEVDGQTGTQALGRLTGIADFDCTSVATGATATPALNQTASWFLPERNGEGFIVQVLDDTTAFINWFTFDAVGHPAWYTGIAYVAAESLVMELLSTSGGRFGPDHNPDDVVRQPVGRLELNLGCETGWVNYDLDPVFGPSGNHNLTRLTGIDGLTCRENRFVPADASSFVGQWLSIGFGFAADVTAETATAYQVTATSCLPVLSAPTDDLVATTTDLRVSIDGELLELDTLDSVSTVRLRRVSALPAVCQGGGTPFTNDPVVNYDAFAATFDELYAAFDVRGVDWAAQQATFGPRVTAATNDDQLFDVFSDMVAPLGDLHTSIQSPTRWFGSGATPEVQAYFQRAVTGVEVDNIIRSYVVGPQRIAAAGDINYGILGPGVGYLEVRSWSLDSGGNSTVEQLAFLRNELTRVFDFFTSENVDKLVLDMRRNGGGNANVSYELAGRFLRGQSRTIFSERRFTQGGSLSGPVLTTLSPEDRPPFDGDLVLLIGPITGSAAESFTFAIRSLPHATLIGAPTAGVLSRTGRVLPNQWAVSLTIGQIASPEGELFEAVGIPPDITVPVFTDAEYDAERDSAIEAALDFFASD